MCGIAGSINSSDTNNFPVTNMIELLDHRGPDSQTVFRLGPATFGISRLAVVDLENGRQPIVNEMKQVITVFNGEIYNFQELRDFLINRGYIFKSRGDAEVISNLYLEYGINFIEKLQGMFAIAIYDLRSDKTYLIRDRFGKKPLFYYTKGDTLYFSSEPRSLFKVIHSKSINIASVNEVMRFGYIKAPHSMLKEIHSVLPGSYLIFGNAINQQIKYWDFDIFNENSSPFTKSEALDFLNDEIRKSVKIRLNAERPIGVFLSGGVDSSLVTSYVSEISSSPVKSFSIGFDNRLFDESNFASQVANILGTEHQTIILNPNSNDLERVLGHLDQPLADSSFFASYFLNEAARNHIVVALGGDGGDEIMGGYLRYQIIPLLQKINQLLKLVEISNLYFKTNNFYLSRISDLLHSASRIEDRYVRAMEINHDESLIGFLKQNCFIDKKLLNQTFWDDNQMSNLRYKLMKHDALNYLPGDLLVKADLASMAHGIELRSPFLDHNFVESMSSIPLKYKVNSFGTKILLKELASLRIPNVDFYRKKMGFGIPRADWLRGPFKEIMQDTLLSKQCRQRGWFNPDAVENKINDHLSGKNQDNLLWPALILESWAQQWI